MTPPDDPEEALDRGHADTPLREALRQASDHERLSVVLVFGAPANPDAGAPPRPEDFSSRVEYRRALIGRRQPQRDAMADHIAHLQGLGLTVASEPSSEVVVASGPASALREALAYPPIERASLDRSHELARGVPSTPSPETASSPPPGALHARMSGDRIVLSGLPVIHPDRSVRPALLFEGLDLSGQPDSFELLLLPERCAELSPPQLARRLADEHPLGRSFIYASSGAHFDPDQARADLAVELRPPPGCPRAFVVVLRDAGGRILSPERLRFTGVRLVSRE